MLVTSFPTQFHHHHHVVPLAQIFLTLSHHFSLSFISSGRSSGLHPVYSHNCCMYVLAGRTALARPYVGVYRSTSLMSSSLLLQKCPACLARLTWIVFVMGGRWPYSWCFVGCCRQDLSREKMLDIRHFCLEGSARKSYYFRLCQVGHSYLHRWWICFGIFQGKEDSPFKKVMLAASSLALLRLSQEIVVVQGLSLNIALVILQWFIYAI